MQVPSEKRAALFPFWSFMHEHEAGADPEGLACAGDEIRAQLALAAGSHGMTFAAFLNGVEDDEHGIALIRLEDDIERLLPQVMIIDKILISPALPPSYRPFLQEAMVQSLRMLGEANGKKVRLWTDYDI